MDAENPTPVNQWRTKVSDENPELLRKAQEELNENPEQRDRDIETLRKMVLEEENLKSPTDDAFLLMFLRVRKFNVEQAFKSLQQYYSIRNKFPSIFTNYRPSSFLNFLKDRAFFALPYRDQLGRAILLGRCGRWDPSKSTVEDTFTAMHMSAERALLEEETQVNGIVCIADLKYFGFVHACQATPNAARKLAALFQDCLPARFKGFHFIFEPVIFDLVFMVLKSFLSKKTRSRVYFHGDNLESLHEHIDPLFLPEDYGGLQPPAETAAELHLRDLLANEEQIANQMANSGYHLVGERGETS